VKFEKENKQKKSHHRYHKKIIIKWLLMEYSHRRDTK